MKMNGGIKKFTSCEQNIIRIGALHLINNSEDFRKCLGEIEMDEDVKNKIQHDMDEYQQDKELAMVYDLEKHNEFVRKSKERALERQRQMVNSGKKELNAARKEFDNEKKEFDKEKDSLMKEKTNFAIELLSFGKNIGNMLNGKSQIIGKRLGKGQRNKCQLRQEQY